MRDKTFRLEIFLIALAAILLEISYTRIFSFKLYYYFTYLILGIALLGLGAGGVFVALFPRLRSVAPERVIPGCALVAATLIPFAYLQVALTQINAIDLSDSVFEVFKLALTCLAVFTPFLMVGISLATIFGSRPSDINRLYFSDLIGAGVGCAIVVPLFVTITPVGSILVAALMLAAAAGLATLGRWRAGSLASGVVAVALLGCLMISGSMPDPVAARSKTMSPQKRGDKKIIFSRWSSVFRVDVMEQAGGSYHLIHDGMVGSAVYRFDGDLSKMSRMSADIRSKPFSVLKKNPKVLIIGSAGGHEILASLYFGAGSITGVELNPVTVSLLTDHLRDFTGNIAYHEKVDLVNAEGRSFLERDPEKYDLIWFVAPDSYAAMNAASSGAYVLSESYLYTVEMLEVAFDHLTENGVICAQFGELNFASRPNHTTRYLATAREALARRGITDFASRVVLSTGPGMFPSSTIIVKNEPFTPDEFDRYRANAKNVPRTKIWNPGASARTAAHPVEKMITWSDRDLERFYAEYPWQVMPVTDDSPFFWHFSRFRDVWQQPWRASRETADFAHVTGERTLLILLGLATALAAVFLLLPLLAARGVWSRVPYKANAFLYFAGLGLGFMFFEVALIQKLTLFLGYPTYSLTVTLFSVLVFSGIGSLLSERYSQRRNRALAILFSVLVALTLLYQFALQPLLSGFSVAGLPVRALVVVFLLAPLGLCLGAFMPIGLGTLAKLTEHRREYIAWGWAVNGFFSVVSSVLATILAMAFGFHLVLSLALAVYAIGIAAMSRVHEPVSGS
ncbi:MAG: hypothetical protein ACE5FL_06605 [Myxococcota bacterium]